MLDIVTDALAQPIASPAEILREPTIWNRIAGRQREYFLLQLGVPHRFENAACVHALLGEQFDLVNVHLPAGGADDHVDFDRVRSGEELAERRLSGGYFAVAE